MRKLTLPQLERRLFAAADILRARWGRLRDEAHHNVGGELNEALGALAENNTAATARLAATLKELGYA